MFEDINRKLVPEIILQNNYSEEEFWKYLSKWKIMDANDRTSKELENYLEADFRRFCLTFSILPEVNDEKRCFEIGANPYFLSLLIKKYTKYNLEMSNYFERNSDTTNQNLIFKSQALKNQILILLIRI